jgi:hypothetical protein
MPVLPLTLPDGKKVTEISLCEDMIEALHRLGPDRTMTILKEYCTYESAGPSYTLIRHPNGRVVIQPW